MSNSKDGGENHLAGCQWIVFDAVGTLIQPNPTVAGAYHAVGTKYGTQLSVPEISQRFRTAFRQSETDLFPGGPPPGMSWRTSDAIEVARWNWIVRQVVPDVSDIDACFRELWDHFARPSSWMIFDDVGETLRGLKRAGYRLAIASNFDSRLHSVCDGHVDLQPIERRFVSSETGFRKPSPDFFDAVINRLECPSNQILMVGDDAEHDVNAPAARGMRALLIDRSQLESRQGLIHSLTQLIPSN